jgi:outer membrane protein OmpA-like peptidoglycan-associated protein
MSKSIFSAKRPFLAALLSAVLVFTTATGAGAIAGYGNPGAKDPVDQSFSGAYIIDAGAVSAGTNVQTKNQGLKPYGLIYALIKAEVPVQWVINPNKTDAVTGATLSEVDQVNGNNGVDFTYDCDGTGTAYASKKYRTGAFVIPADFSFQAKPIIDSWKANTLNAGLVVDGPCSAKTPVLPVFATITSWPRAILDTQNGKVAVDYFNNAGIPAPPTTIDPTNPPAYRYASPAELTPCDDIYVMPHADPTWATHSQLLPFVKAGGAFYASCHAVSEIENLKYPSTYADTNLRNKVAMNFLSTGKTDGSDALVHYGSHVEQGTPPYNFYKPSSAAEFIAGDGTSVAVLRVGDPVAQFLGTTDAATQAGSEQIFIPIAGSKWRPTTQIITYDPSQKDATAQGTGPAASVLYGPAFGDAANGWVMYEGGHSLNKGTAGDVAAQRAFFNFLLLTAIDRREAGTSAASRTPIVSVTSPAPGTAIPANGSATIPVKATATGGSGSYSYKWASTCFDASGTQVAGGSFANAILPSTTFTKPTVASGSVNCNITLQVIDTCGRFSFGYSSVTFSQPADLQLTGSQSNTGSVTSNASLTYTYNIYNAGSTAGGSSDGRVAISAQLAANVPAGTIFLDAVAYESDGTTILSGASCAEFGGTITCDVGDIADEGHVIVKIRVKVDSTVSTAAVKQDASVNSKSADSDLSNNTSTFNNDRKAVGIKIVYDANKLFVDWTGGSVTYSYFVTNLGSAELSSITVTDDKNNTVSYVSGDTNTDNKLQASEKWVYTSSREIKWNGSSNGSVVNGSPWFSDFTDVYSRQSTATATGTDATAGSVSSTDDAVVQIAAPGITASVTPGSQIVASGDNASFTIKVQNSSNQAVTLSNIKVWTGHNAGGTLLCKHAGQEITLAAASPSTTYQIPTLAKGEIWTADCTITGVTGTQGSSKGIDLSAEAANPLKSGSLTSSATGTISINVPKITIQKTGSVATLTRGIDNVLPYQVVLKNTDSITATSVVLRDTPAAGMTLGKAHVTYKSVGGAAATVYRTGLIAYDKFVSNSSGTGWKTNWSGTGSGVDVITSADSNWTNENYVFKFAPKNNSKTTSRSIALNGLDPDHTYIAFECTSYYSSSSSSKNPKMTITAQNSGSGTTTTLLSSKTCTNSSSQARNQVIVPIDSATIKAATSSGTTITFKVANSKDTTASYFMDDLSVISGLVAMDNFTGGLGSSSVVASGTGWASSTWATTGNLKANLIAQNKYGTDIEWKPASSSTDANAGILTRNFTLSANSWQAATLSFTCRHEAFNSSQDTLKIRVNGTEVYSEVNTVKTGPATAAGAYSSSCATYGTQSNYRNVAIALSSTVAAATGTMSVAIEMSGDKYIGIDDVMLTASPNGSAIAAHPDQDLVWVADSTMAGRWKINLVDLYSNEVATVTYDATVLAADTKTTDLDMKNTASVIAGNQTSPNASTISTPFALSVFSITKTASAYSVASGSNVTFTYVVKNNGDLPTSGTEPALVDGSTTVTTKDTTATVLRPGDTWTFTRTVSNLTADLTEEAVFSGTTDSGPFSETASTTVTVVSGSITFSVDHAAQYAYLGDQVTFLYTVSNDGNEPVKQVSIAPPFCKTFKYVSGDIDGDAELDSANAGSGVETWTYRCVTDAITTDKSVTAATANANGTTFGNKLTQKTLNISITLIDPKLTITKSARNNSGSWSAYYTDINSANELIVQPANSVEYTYKVKNTSTSSDVIRPKVNDADCANPTYVSGGSGSSDVTLSPNEEWTFTCSAASKSQTIDAIAYASGEDQIGGDVQSDAVSLRIKVVAAHLLLEVTAEKEYVKYGESNTYTYKITNDGELDITSFTIPNGVCSPLVGPVQTGTSGSHSNTVLEIGETWTYTCTQTNVTTDQLVEFSLTGVNSAGGATNYTPAPSATKAFVIDPTMTVSALVSAYTGGLNGTMTVAPGTDIEAALYDTLKYDYTVSSGATTHSSSVAGLNTMLINNLLDGKCANIIAVEDSLGYNVGDGNATSNPPIDPNGQLDPGEQWKFTCSTDAYTQTAAVVDSQVEVQAASVAESFTIRAASLRVRVAGAVPTVPLSGGTTIITGPGLAPDIEAAPGTYSKKLTLKVYFKGDSAKLIAATKAKIAAFVKKIKAAGGTPSISVIGKVKETADKSYDIRLSTQRAVNVANQMKLLKASGKYKTVAAGISPENKAISRRVEITAIWPKTATK